MKNPAKKVYHFFGVMAQDSNILLMIFYLIAKFGISASYLIVYPFAGVQIHVPPELYPTEVRGLGLGFSAYVGGIGICCIPLINYLGRAHLVIPLVIMGLVSVAGGFGCSPPARNFEHHSPNNDRGSSPSPSLMEDGLSLTSEARNEPQHIQLTMLRQKVSMRSEELGSNNSSQDQGSRGEEEEAHEQSPLRGNELRRSSSRRKRLVRQGSNTLEAPTDSTGAIMITPWW
ncbi:Organic cation transporter 1 [Orchesella cincta]|uniref:Organic cation transporter 1 n=1 Tax=Orchesella cincta TaxID=48709 RepID=A0A1D2MSE4_ORCCI|nr:Organic cation transporter 1 [Orchesella cincta]